MPSGVRNSCDTIDTKLLRNWPNSFSLASVRNSSFSTRLRSVMSAKKPSICCSWLTSTISAETSTRMDCAPKGAKLALDFTHRPIAPEICPELVAGLEIQPHSQLRGVVTKNAVPVQPEPSGKRIVHLDKFPIAHPRESYNGRAGTKGPAEALLAFAQARLAITQKPFRADEFGRAFCDTSLE